MMACLREWAQDRSFIAHCVVRNRSKGTAHIFEDWITIVALMPLKHFPNCRDGNLLGQFQYLERKLPCEYFPLSPLKRRDP